MLEITTTRHNLMVDPALSVWGWEIPMYLFIGGVVAGTMILAGVNMLRTARGEDTGRFFSVQTPILAVALLSLGMLALFLDLEHPLYVWAVYVAFEPLSPMSWGSWILLLVYPVLLASALIRLDEGWPWLGARLPILKRLSDAILAQPARMRLLGYANLVLGVGLGIYTGILLSTMASRPLWNSAILGPLFLVSGLSAAAAMVHLATRLVPGRPAPRGLLGGAAASLVQPLGTAYPPKHMVDQVVRADLVFLVVELVLIALLIIGLLSSTESHIAAVGLLTSGMLGGLFWGVVVGAGILLPLAWQWLEVNHRIPHTVLPALLVLAGGFVLRWVIVQAGQASEIVRAAAVFP